MRPHCAPSDLITTSKVVIVELSGCKSLESKILEELNVCSMKLFDLLALRGDEIPTNSTTTTNNKNNNSTNTTKKNNIEQEKSINDFILFPCLLLFFLVVFVELLFLLLVVVVEFVEWCNKYQHQHYE